MPWALFSRPVGPNGASRFVILSSDLFQNGRRSENLIGLLPQEVQSIELGKECG